MQARVCARSYPTNVHSGTYMYTYRHPHSIPYVLYANTKPSTGTRTNSATRNVRMLKLLSPFHLRGGRGGEHAFGYIRQQGPRTVKLSEVMHVPVSTHFHNTFSYSLPSQSSVYKSFSHFHNIFTYSLPSQLSVYKSFRSLPLLAARLAARRYSAQHWAGRTWAKLAWQGLNHAGTAGAMPCIYRPPSVPH